MQAIWQYWNGSRWKSESVHFVIVNTLLSLSLSLQTLPHSCSRMSRIIVIADSESFTVRFVWLSSILSLSLSLSLFSLSPDFTSLLLQNVSDHCDSRQSEGLTVRFVWPPSILSTILLKNYLEWTSSKCVRNDNCFNSIHYWHLYCVIKKCKK